MRALFSLVSVFLLLGVPAHATSVTYEVSYYLRGDIAQPALFYGPGTYEFLLGPGYIPVYLKRDDFDFIGMYGAPALGSPQAILPASMPAIVFPAGTNGAVAVPITIVGTPRVAVPEPSSLLLLGVGLVGLGLMKRRAGRI